MAASLKAVWDDDDGDDSHLIHFYRTSGFGGCGTTRWSLATPCRSTTSGKACLPKLMLCTKIAKGSLCFSKVKKSFFTFLWIFFSALDCTCTHESTWTHFCHWFHVVFSDCKVGAGNVPTNVAMHQQKQGRRRRGASKHGCNTDVNNTGFKIFKKNNKLCKCSFNFLTTFFFPDSISDSKIKQVNLQNKKK